MGLVAWPDPLMALVGTVRTRPQNPSRGLRRAREVEKTECDLPTQIGTGVEPATHPYILLEVPPRLCRVLRQAGGILRGRE